MNDLKVRQWVVGFGLAAFVVFFVALLLCLVCIVPGDLLEATARFQQLGDKD